MIARKRIQEAIVAALKRQPGVALLGPRQCGKTTLARQVAAETGARIFDLENPDDAAALDNPMLALEGLRGLVVLDEVQRRPELQNACGFLRDGRRRDLLETVQSFGEYDALFSIDSWSKYVGVWYGLKQVTCAADVRSGYCGNESTSAEKLANWWFHGVLNHAKVKVLGLEKSGNGYFYTYSQISEMGVRSAMDAIRSACRE